MLFPLSHLLSLDNASMFVTGETGIGKSTLIDTLFNTNLKDKKSSHFYSNVGLKIQTYELQESNVQLKLTVVKTVGYGDQINKEARLVFSYFNYKRFSYFKKFSFFVNTSSGYLSPICLYLHRALFVPLASLKGICYLI